MISWSIPISKGLKACLIFLKYDRVLISAFIIVILFCSLGIDIYMVHHFMEIRIYCLLINYGENKIIFK